MKRCGWIVFVERCYVYADELDRVRSTSIRGEMKRGNIRICVTVRWVEFFIGISGSRE